MSTERIRSSGLIVGAAGAPSRETVVARFGVGRRKRRPCMSEGKRPRDLGGTRKTRGGVLLLILVIIVVLSAMILQFTEKAMTEIAAEGHYVERNRLRLTAYSALETTLADLADIIAIEGSLKAPGQGWTDPLGDAGYEPPPGTKVTVTFSDESGKLPLNHLDQQTLVQLFTEMGFSNQDTFKLADSLLDWIDPDDDVRIDGAESDVYGDEKNSEWPYQASNQRVHDLSELAVVDGFRQLFFDEAGQPNQYFRTFADAVSVYTDGTLNINSAPDLVLRTLGGLGDPQITAIRDYMAGADRIAGTADDRYFDNTEALTGLIGQQLAANTKLGVKSTVLRVRIDVSEGVSHFALAAVVRSGRSQKGGANSRSTFAGNQPNQTGPVGSSNAIGDTSVTYPFVFLELKEDVGQNDSIAAPPEQTRVASAQ